MHVSTLAAIDSSLDAGEQLPAWAQSHTNTDGDLPEQLNNGYGHTLN